MRDVVFFGAGASLVGEAGLPLFADIRKAVLNASGVRRDVALSTAQLDEALAWLAPEAVLLRFDQAGVDVDDIMLDLFNSCDARPNVAHALAAQIAANGGAVWTTNYDTLIEEAAADLGQPLTTAVPARHADPGSAPLVKLHGSFLVRSPGGRWLGTDGPLAFSAPQILAGVPAPYRRRFLADVTGARLWVLGYAGQDIDIAPVMRDGIQAAAEVRWLVLRPSELPGLQSRYPDLTIAPGRARVYLSQVPVATFIQLITDVRPDLVLLGAGRETRSWPLTLPELPKAALQGIHRLRLLYQLGFGEAAGRLEWSLLRSPTLSAADRQEVVLRKVRRSASWLRRQLWFRPALMLGSALPARRPRTLARKLASEDVRASERWPPGERLRRWLDQEWDPAVALGTVRRLGFEGDLNGALEVVDDALSRARRDPEHPDRIGSFSFQRGEVLRMRGEIGDAREEALKGLAAVSSTSLALWEEFTRLSCTVSQGQPLTRRELKSAHDLIRLFDDIAETGGTLWVQVLLAVDAKNDRRDADAARDLASAQRRAKKERLVQLVSLSALHRADAHRCLGDLDAMSNALRGIGPWCLHPLFADLVQLAAREADRSSWSSLGEEFKRRGCAYGSELVEQVLTSATPGDTVAPQPDVRVTFL